MSGIVALVNTDGAPVSAELLRAMTEFMRFRGPDADGVWNEGPVGLGHTLLRTRAAPAEEKQPLSLDGRTWLTADVRLDGRDELVAKLALPASRLHTDAELILRSYERWGEDCVLHLIGDYAFVLWDGQRRKLFCARDRFGIKPLFHSAMKNGLLVGNTLECVRLHPGISNELDELAVADYLMFGQMRLGPETFFRDIKRLPAGHTLAWTPGAEPRLRRYWDLPDEPPLMLKHPQDYVEQFRALLTSAVQDRLTGASAVIQMSGGMDSTSVAAVAKAVSEAAAPRVELAAVTGFTRHLPYDQEPEYAKLVARHLGLRHMLECISDEALPTASDLHLAEPVEGTNVTQEIRRAAEVIAGNRIVLTGMGGDVSLLGEPFYARTLWRQGRLWQLARETYAYWRRRGRIPALGFRAALTTRFGKPVDRTAFPPWFNAGLARRHNLQWRYDNHLEAAGAKPGRWRAEAHRALCPALWGNTLEFLDPGVHRVAAEFRHPYYDSRLIHFLLRLPPVPWCVNKEIVRSAMTGLLPPATLSRPKTTLAGHLGISALKSLDLQPFLERFERAQALARFFDVRAFMRIARNFRRLRTSEYTWVSRPITLMLWLDNQG